MAITAQQLVDERFRSPAIADYMASLSAEERAIFNQGKDCALAILTHWLMLGGGVEPSDIENLDAALSHKIGFTCNGFPLGEEVAA